MSKPLSGAQRASQNVQLFEQYLTNLKARGERLPLRSDGQVNLSKVAQDSGIGDRGRLYTNERIKALLDAARQEAATQTRVAEPAPPVTPVRAADAGVERLERHLHRLEQQNAALMAENTELRSQMRELRLQLGREDMMIESGRRIPPPTVQAG